MDTAATGPVGFIGIGNMGWPMAANLRRAGFDVLVHDGDAGRMAAFAAEHGGRAATLAQMGSSADVVVTMLPTGAIVRDVVLGTGGEGLAASLRPGAVVVDMSSSDPVGTRELGAALASRGVRLVDAPVSGAVPRARDATLTIMIGGDDTDAVARAKPVLSAMGNRLFETGPMGSGHAMKALNNYVAAAGFAAASEALILGGRFGLDPGLMIDIMNVSTGRNFSTESTIKSQVLTGAFASGFALPLLAKDVKIAADLARGIGADTPLVALVSRMWSEALDEQGATVDHTAAYTTWSRRAGGGTGAD